MPWEKHKRNEEKTVPILMSERFSQGWNLLLPSVQKYTNNGKLQEYSIQIKSLKLPLTGQGGARNKFLSKIFREVGTLTSPYQIPEQLQTKRPRIPT